METRRWVNRSHPQTLLVLTLMLYIEAVFTLLGLGLQYIVLPGSTLGGSGDVSNILVQIGLPIAMAAAAYLVANEKKAGYQLALAVTALPLLCRLLLMFGIGFGPNVGSVGPLDYDVIGLMIEVALFALVLHPQSRDYERIWFR
jgi:hypothetical protein